MGGRGKYPFRLGSADDKVGMDENEPSRPAGDDGENGRLGR